MKKDTAERAENICRTERYSGSFRKLIQKTGGMQVRGVETRIQGIRHSIFTEIARMAYETDGYVGKRIEELPYEIIPGEIGNFRNDVFLERAIVGERLRLAMGLPCRGGTCAAVGQY